MAATRARLVVEFRNGDNNFLAMYSGEFVASNGETDRAALDAAYLSLCQKRDEQYKLVCEELERAGKLRPHHD